MVIRKTSHNHTTSSVCDSRRIGLRLHGVQLCGIYNLLWTLSHNQLGVRNSRS